MSSRDLDASLLALRAAALRAIARREGVVLDSRRVDDALAARDFATAIDRVRAAVPWYVARVQAVRYWIAGRRG